MLHPAEVAPHSWAKDLGRVGSKVESTHAGWRRNKVKPQIRDCQCPDAVDILPVEKKTFFLSRTASNYVRTLAAHVVPVSLEKDLPSKKTAVGKATLGYTGVCVCVCMQIPPKRFRWMIVRIRTSACRLHSYIHIHGDITCDQDPSRRRCWCRKD